VITPEAESSRSFLIPTRNPNEMGLDVENGELNDVRNVLSIFIQSTSLWFRVEYNIGGVRRCLTPIDFISARADREVKDEILGTTASEINEGSQVLVTIINPRSPEM